MLGYWSACLQSPDKVLFLKYEDLKNDTVFYVKKTAAFMGFPFSLEEEGKGTVQKMVDMGGATLKGGGAMAPPKILKFF